MTAEPTSTTAAAAGLSLPAPVEAEGEAISQQQQQQQLPSSDSRSAPNDNSAATPSTAAPASDADEFEALSDSEEEEEEEESQEEEEEIEYTRAPPIFGYMYKKSPGAFRIRPWDWRFFVVSDMRIMWWKNREACVPEVESRGRASTDDVERRASRAEMDPQCKGMVNLLVSDAELQEDPSSPSTFFLLPPDGEWADGATTDKHQDKKRVYVFDVAGSEHSRSVWMDVIRQHIEQASAERRLRGDGGAVSFAQSEYWEDDTVDNEQMAAAARMLRKLEDRRLEKA